MKLSRGLKKLVICLSHKKKLGERKFNILSRLTFWILPCNNRWKKYWPLLPFSVWQKRLLLPHFTLLTTISRIPLCLRGEKKNTQFLAEQWPDPCSLNSMFSPCKKLFIFLYRKLAIEIPESICVISMNDSWLHHHFDHVFYSFLYNQCKKCCDGQHFHYFRV